MKSHQHTHDVRDCQDNPIRELRQAQELLGFVRDTMLDLLCESIANHGVAGPVGEALANLRHAMTLIEPMLEVRVEKEVANG